MRQQLKKYLPTTTDKAEGEALLGRVRSVQEYFEDLAEVVESTGLGGVVEGAIPIAGAVGEALAETLAPVKFLVKLFGKLTSIDDPNELAYLACTLAYRQACLERFCRESWVARLFPRRLPAHDPLRLLPGLLHVEDAHLQLPPADLAARLAAGVDDEIRAQVEVEFSDGEALLIDVR